MGVPLLRSWGEERVSKESSVFYVVGAAMTVFHGRDGPHLQRGGRETGTLIPPKGTLERTGRLSSNCRFVSRLVVVFVIYYGFMRLNKLAAPCVYATCDFVCLLNFRPASCALCILLATSCVYFTCGFVRLILLAASCV